MSLSTILLATFAVLLVNGAPQTYDDVDYYDPENVDGDFYPESEDLGSKPESEDLGRKPESEDLGSKPESEELGSKPESEDLGSKPESEELGSKPAESDPNYGDKLLSIYDGSLPDSGDVETNYEDALPENEPSQPETEPSEPVYQTSPPDNKVFLPDVETSEPEYSSSSSSSSSSSVLTSSVRDGSCSPLHYPCGESFPGCCEDAPICKCDRLHFCSCRYRAGPVRPFVKYVAPECQKMYHPCGKDFPKCCDEVPVCHCHDNQKWRCVCVEEYEGSIKQGEEEEKKEV